FFDLAILRAGETTARSPGPGRHPALFVKQRAERTQAAEPAVEANRGHWDFGFLEEELRPLQPALLQVLVRRLPERRLECPQQMKGRETRDGRDFAQADRRAN